MRRSLILVLACLATGACTRNESNANPKRGGASGASSRTSKGTTPAKPPEQWTLDEMAGVYVWGCDDKQWTSTRLKADGMFAETHHTTSGESVTRGKIVRVKDKLTLSDKAPHLAGLFSHHLLRFHQGRKVLVSDQQVASFDLLPSWWQASVRLGPDESRADLCKKIAAWPKLNPPAPKNPKVRLPATFTLTFPVKDPGGIAQARVVVKSAPWWAQAEVCPAGCTIPDPMSLRRPGDWAKLNRLWWAQAAAPAKCPGEDPAMEPYTLSVGGSTSSGDLTGHAESAEIPSDPCKARGQIVRWVSNRVHTRHPPALPGARRPPRPPR